MAHTPLLLYGERGLFTLPCFTQQPAVCAHDIKSMIFSLQHIPVDEQRLVLQGRELEDDFLFHEESAATLPPVRLLLRLDGGKGGFGSMLRALGAQRSGHETDNIESCRDISGRRLRHVNDEKKIAEWIAKQKEEQAERERRRREKLEQQLRAPKHTFDHHALAVRLDEQAQDVREAIEHAKHARPLAVPKAKRPRFADDELDVSSSSEHADSQDEAGAGEEKAGAEAASAAGAGGAGAAAVGAAASEGRNEKIGNGEARGTEGGVASSGHSSMGAAGEREASAAAADGGAADPKKAAGPGHGVPEPSKSAGRQGGDGKEGGEGKEHKAAELPRKAVDAEPLDLEAYDSIEALEALGLDRLKAALLAAKEKCGGTLRQRAERLFALKTATGKGEVKGGKRR